MTTAVQRRRGTTTEHASFTGLEGEISVNTTKETLVVHDGSTAGGFELARADGSNFVATSVDINGGTIDGTTIGASSASTGAFTTLTASGEITANGGIALGDNDKATFNSNLSIYSSGTSSYIKETGAGSFTIEATNLYLKREGGTESFIDCVTNGAVTLHNDGSPKLATTSTGIDVTGTATMDGLVVDGASDLNGTITVGTTYTTDITGNDVSFFRDNGTSYIRQRGGQALALTTNDGSDRQRIKIDANGDISFYEDTGTTPKFFWDASAESLGIGTSNPDAKLRITGGYEDLFIAAGTNGVLTVSNPSTNLVTMFSGTSDALALGTSNTERFRIAADGSLSTPTLGTSNVRFGVNAGNSIIAGGNYNTVVGDEAGTAITTGDANVAIGYASLSANTTGTENTATGWQSLKENTTGNYNSAFGLGTLQTNTTGSYNTATGQQSLYANTTASNNTASGYRALFANTTGSDNTAVGYQALNATTTGGSNVAVGFAALTFNTTGLNNVAVGRDALAYNTASNNTAVGTSALLLNTTGTNNVAVGAESLDAIVSSNDCTAVGYRALSANTASANTALGSEAMQFNTSGVNNVGIGIQALRNNTTGSENTALGGGALDSNTTANDNTAIGYNALSANTTGASNSVLGAYALDGNTTGANNVAVGRAALGVNSTASNNTAVGYNSLTANTTGASNTAIGQGAGGAITTGSSNTILGRYNGNQNGLDIRTANNYVVLSDGDGYPNAYWRKSIINIPFNVFTTFFTIPTTDQGVYTITIGLDNQTTSDWCAYAVIKSSGSPAVFITNSGSTNVTLQISGLNVQVKQVGTSPNLDLQCRISRTV